MCIFAVYLILEYLMLFSENCDEIRLIYLQLLLTQLLQCIVPALSPRAISHVNRKDCP